MMELKNCPICGKPPIYLHYSNYPLQFTYSHCGIFGGYGACQYDALVNWNNTIKNMFFCNPHDNLYPNETYNPIYKNEVSDFIWDK